MIDDLLFADEREQPLRFSVLTEARAVDSDGASLRIYQLADGELVLPTAELAQHSSHEQRQTWLASSREELSLKPVLMTEALDQLAGKLVHVQAAEGFFGDIALGEELARIIMERAAQEQIFVTARSLRLLRAFSMDRPDLYFGWHLDEKLLGGPLPLEDHPIFELLPATRVAALAPWLAIEANVIALQQSGHAVGVIGEAPPGSLCDWVEPNR